MDLIFHLLKQIKNFIKYPLQYSNLLMEDLKKDYFSNNKKEFNKIIIVGAPKSGTTLLEWILSEIGYINQTISPLRIFYEKNLNHEHDLSYKMLKYIPDNKFSFLKRHSDATNANIKLIQDFNFKIILSTRNLKDMMISRYLHLISDNRLPQYAQLKNLSYIDGFKLSLKQNHKKNEVPIKRFSEWFINWEKKIKEKNIECLILNYDEFTVDKKKYISKILEYLNIKDFNPDQIIEKHLVHLKRLKTKNLKDNLTKNLHAQTYNHDFKDVKSLLKKNFTNEDLKSVLENYN